MNPAIHATAPSGDEVTLEANAQLGARGRTVAQVEQNAMHALNLVRAALIGLDQVTKGLDRAALLLAHNHQAIDPAVRPELRRTLEQLGEHLRGATLHGEPLLQGGSTSFALQEPGDDISEPLIVELPALEAAFSELVEAELSGGSHAWVSQRHETLASEVQLARRQLEQQAARLGEVLAHRRRIHAPAAQRRAEDEGFIAMIQQVRDDVLHAGEAALLVQGSPSVRAAWLVEAIER